MLPVVYVHVGSKPAPHLIDSIVQTRRVSPATPIFAILSRNTAMAAEVESHNAKIVWSDTLQMTAAHADYVGNIRRRLGKKRGFWRFATERFFLIEECMTQLEMPAALHLESDNFIFFDVHSVEPILKQLYPAMAAAFVNDNECVPGVVYIGDRAVLAALNQYIARRVAEEAAEMRKWYKPRFLTRVRMGLKLNDMILLADFAKSGSPDRLRPLPMVPPDYPIAANETEQRRCKACYSYGYEQLGMVFDGLSFGQYLYGLDPGHHDAEGTAGMMNPRFCVRATDFGFDGFDVNDRESGPHITYNGARIRLASLHNHSKRKLFTD